MTFHAAASKPFVLRSGPLPRPRLEGPVLSGACPEPCRRIEGRSAARSRAAIWALPTRFETAAKNTRPPQRERRVEGLRLTKGSPQICRTPLCPCPRSGVERDCPVQWPLEVWRCDDRECDPRNTTASPAFVTVVSLRSPPN